jgi:hypothetical protein
MGGNILFWMRTAMIFRTGAALLVFIVSGSFAVAADAHNAPADRPAFPVPVENGMAHLENPAETNYGVIEIFRAEICHEGAKDDSRRLLALEQIAPHRARRPSQYDNPPPSARVLEQHPELKKAFQAFIERSPGSREQLREGMRRYDWPPLSPYVGYYLLRDEADRPISARTLLEKAVVETPKDAEPWLIFGDLALRDNRVGEAKLDYAKAQELAAAETVPARKAALEACVMKGAAQVAKRCEKWPEVQWPLQDLRRRDVPLR